MKRRQQRNVKLQRYTTAILDAFRNWMQKIENLKWIFVTTFFNVLHLSCISSEWFNILGTQYTLHMTILKFRARLIDWKSTFSYHWRDMWIRTRCYICVRRLDYCHYRINYLIYNGGWNRVHYSIITFRKRSYSHDGN